MSPQPISTKIRDLPAIALRTVTDADLDALFDQMRDPESGRSPRPPRLRRALTLSQ